MGVKMADEKEWDPTIGVRAREGLKRLKDMLNPQAVMVFLFPNKE